MGASSGGIAALLSRLVGQPPATEVPPSEALRREVAIHRGEDLLENLQAIADAGEAALRSSIRALQERAMLLRRMVSVAQATGDSTQADAARREADQLQEQVRELHALAASVRGETP